MNKCAEYGLDTGTAMGLLEKRAMPNWLANVLLEVPFRVGQNFAVNGRIAKALPSRLGKLFRHPVGSMKRYGQLMRGGRAGLSGKDLERELERVFITRYGTAEAAALPVLGGGVYALSRGRGKHESQPGVVG